MSRLERELAFWIQFAEIWKDLAEISEDRLRRVECVKRAETCLSRARQVRESIEKSNRSEDDQLGECSTNSTVS